MKNTLISYANLAPKIKREFKTWLHEEDQDEITFPFRGALTSGYVFTHDDTTYLIAMNAKAVMNVVDEDDEEVSSDIIDLEAEGLEENEDAA